MPCSVTKIIDIIANSVSLRDEESVANILDILLKRTDAIQPVVGIPSETLTTLQKISR